MGEAKTQCPHCNRQPGQRHEYSCPRSGLQAALRLEAAEEAGVAQVVYPGLGPCYAMNREGGVKEFFNHGVPYVNHEKYPFKSWRAGGVSNRLPENDEFAKTRKDFAKAIRDNIMAAVERAKDKLREKLKEEMAGD